MAKHSSTIQLTLTRPHAGQQKIIDEAKRFNVVCAGRRFGKSLLGQNRLITSALLKGLPSAWFSPSYKSAGDVWRELQLVLRPIISDINQQERRLVIRGGGELEVWSLDNPDAGRGRSYAVTVIDEASQVGDLRHAWEQNIRPMLSDYSGAAWFLSTPRGVSSYFHCLFLKGQGQDANWRSWQSPTGSNPFIPADEIELMRADMADLTYRQEILAEFVSFEGAVFRSISDAILKREPAGKPAVIGCDWARSASGDYTAFVVISDPGEVLQIDRFRGAEYAVQRDRLLALWEKHGKPAIRSESNAMGGVLNEQLRRDGIPVMDFITTNASKASAVGTLQMAFERGAIRIPDDLSLVGELSSFEAHPLPGGLMRYSAPDGAHDDLVMALAIAWSDLEGLRARRDSWPEDLDPFGLSELVRPSAWFRGGTFSEMGGRWKH